jgi:glutamate transport system substrate-binding protein
MTESDRQSSWPRPSGRRATLLSPVVAFLLFGAFLAGCGSSPASPHYSGSVNIGEAKDSAGWDVANADGTRTGFDADFVNWIGLKLGFRPVSVDVIAANREAKLQSGDVKLIIATYSIDDARRKLVGFAGPYMVTQQGIMVRSADRARYRTVEDISNRSVCVTKGSTSAAELDAIKIAVTPVTMDSYAQCLDLLNRKKVDVISTDQLLLVGMAQRHPEDYVPQDIIFGHQERYGIGLPKGDKAACEIMTEQIKAFLISDQWDIYFNEDLPGVSIAGHKPDPNDLDPC